MASLPKEFFDIRRHITAFIAGIVGGLIPNDRSNIDPRLMGAILAVLTTKVLIGDYDVGYQWTYKDIIFGIITVTEGVLGSIVVNR